ncbi:MAG: phosphotransferase family protein [Rhodobacteraceae bacterium]|nr:phosphotransferase family protein [Paracoccaceae bacterium]
MKSTAVSAEANSGMTEVRDGFGFDEAALARWMAANVDGFEGPLAVRQFKGGQSNPTYQLVSPGKTYALRRKPIGQLAKGAHAVNREVRVLTALSGADFPVPKVHGLCTDESVIGSWFYVMDTDAGRNPGMDKLVEWLPTAIPRNEETRIIHGDFRCDNLIFHPNEPQVIAVLDWELSTLGCPLADFTYHAMMYRMPPEIVAGMGDIEPANLNIPTGAEYLARYCAATGRTSIRGQAASAHSMARVQQFPKLVKLALDAAEQCR